VRNKDIKITPNNTNNSNINDVGKKAHINLLASQADDPKNVMIITNINKHSIVTSCPNRLINHFNNLRLNHIKTAVSTAIVAQRVVTKAILGRNSEKDA
jgi:hypothetical protein